MFAAQLVPPLLEAEFDILDCQQFPYFPVFVTKVHELLGKSTMVVTWFELWDDYWYEYLDEMAIFGKVIEQLAFRVPETIIPISSAIKQDLIDAGCRATLLTVPNGVDYHSIQTVSPADEPRDVIYVGRLAEHKNVDLLLETVNELSDRGLDINCAIIGDGPERECLSEYANELGVADCVTFFGFVESTDEVLSYLKASDVFVLPSEREGFPNTILEANACGTPSIVCEFLDNGGTAVGEDGTTGFIVSPSAHDIADHIASLLTDTVLRNRLSDNARAFAREHDWEQVTQQLESVYQQAVDEDPVRTLVAEKQ